MRRALRDHRCRRARLAGAGEPWRDAGRAAWECLARQQRSDGSRPPCWRTTPHFATLQAALLADALALPGRDAIERAARWAATAPTAGSPFPIALALQSTRLAPALDVTTLTERLVAAQQPDLGWTAPPIMPAPPPFATDPQRFPTMRASDQARLFTPATCLANLDSAPARDNPSRVSAPPNAGGGAVLQRKVSRRLIQRQAAAATTSPSSEESDREALRGVSKSHFAKVCTAGGFDKLDATALSKAFSAAQRAQLQVFWKTKEIPRGFFTGDATTDKMPPSQRLMIAAAILEAGHRKPEKAGQEATPRDSPPSTTVDPTAKPQEPPKQKPETPIGPHRANSCGHWVQEVITYAGAARPK